MEIVIDLSKIQALLNLPPDVLLFKLFVNVGWIPIAFTLLWGFKEMWMSYIRAKWAEKNANFVLLAIDIPRDNQQSLKAVENLFSYFSGAHGSIDLIEKYWEGKWQLYFSLEIVSIEGYTQFLIYTPEDFRDLTESAVYSQYPDAEITEVDDYTQGYPTRFPDDKYDIWGAEFMLANNHMFPIKTYKEFEHTNDPTKEIFKDPIAALMDLNNSLGPGEQLWYQILLIPTGFDWVKEGDEQISRILGEKTGPDKNIGDKIVDSILSFIDQISEIVYSFGDMGGQEESKEDEPLKMMNLKPKEKRQVEGIEYKTSKIGFETKIRMVYLAEKEVIRKSKVVNGFVGFMKQFGDNALNNIKPDTAKTATKANYFFKDMRIKSKKNRIMNAYVKRDDTAGRKPKILNIEELATIWHFPVATSVRAPLVQTAPGRKAEAPMGLPRSAEQEREAAPTESVPSFFTEGGEEKPPAESGGEKEEKKDTWEAERRARPEKGKTEEQDTSSGPPGNLPTI